MNRTFAGLLLVGFVFFFAADAPAAPAAPAATARRPVAPPVPYFVKSAASLAELEKTLQGKGGKAGDLLKPAATSIEIVLRHEEDFEQAEHEIHDGKDHIFFVTDGQATLTLGGELVAPKEISPGEWRSPKSANSKTVDVAKGDLIFIPHGTLHGRSVKGKRFTMVIASFFPNGPPPPAPAK